MAVIALCNSHANPKNLVILLTLLFVLSTSSIFNDSSQKENYFLIIVPEDWARDGAGCYDPYNKFRFTYQATQTELHTTTGDEFCDGVIILTPGGQ